MLTVGRCFLLLGATCAALVAVAANELGPLPDAQKRHPAVFVSGNVLPYVIAGVEGYTYAGEAEQCFAGGMAETDAELYQEARLDAKGNLLRFLKKERPSCEISMSGGIVMYQYPEGKIRRVVCFVAKEAVSFREQCNAIPDGMPTNAQKVASIPHSARVLAAEKSVADNPDDCLLRCRLARALIKDGRETQASVQYEAVLKIVISDRDIDKTIASESLSEGAQFFETVGSIERALKFYRMLVRCNDMRHWNLSDEILRANRKIEELLSR